MASEFGRGVLAEGPQPPTTGGVPSGGVATGESRPARPTRPPGPHRPVPPAHRKAPNPYGSVAFTAVKFAVVVAVATALVLGLGAIGRLPGAMQDVVADGVEDFGWDFPRRGDEPFERLPTSGPGAGIPASPSITTFDADDLVVDPDEFEVDVPPVDVPVAPPPTPYVPPLP